MEDILERIRNIRKRKGLSYDFMAHELQTSAAAYRKIETNQTKLTVERLLQIAQVLQTKLDHFLDLQADKIYHQTNNDNAVGHQAIENLHADNKDKSDKIAQLYEDRIKEQAATIQQLMLVLNMQKQ